MHQENIYDGARGLPWPLYLQLNEWFPEEGSNECLFAAAFAKTTCNLACRGDNTSQIYMKHLCWEQDCFCIPFCHEKAHQDSGDAFKRLPRHCYSNPLNQAADYSSALFHYLVQFSEVPDDTNGPLFQGMPNSVTKAFSYALNKVKDAHAIDIQRRFNIKPEDIHLYSYRKCAHTRLNGSKPPTVRPGQPHASVAVILLAPSETSTSNKRRPPIIIAAASLADCP